MRKRKLKQEKTEVENNQIEELNQKKTSQKEQLMELVYGEF